MSAVAWHDLECGAYAADLPLWRELAAAAGGPVLDVGAGTGRVALDLAARGVEVVALDREAELLAALRARAGGRALRTIVADARDFALPAPVALVLVPMQTVQLLGGAPGRAAFLAAAARHLLPGGRLAAALADPLEPWDELTAIPPPPDAGTQDGLTRLSQPVRVREDAEGWTIERVRLTLPARGERSEEHDAITLERVSPSELEAEGRAAGFVPAGRRRIAPTEDHVGSEVVILARA